MVGAETSSEEEATKSDCDNIKTLAKINSKNPFIKLMIVGRINEKIKNMIQKPVLSEIDVNLLQGMFTKKMEKRQPQKDIYATFSPKKQSLSTNTTNVSPTKSII